MSIDDKMERRYRERRLSERKNEAYPPKNELISEGFSVGPEEYIYATAIQSEPMAFCPECNGMMLPYLDGHKCKDCGYTKGVSEELIKEAEKNEVQYVRNPEIKVNDYKPKSRIIKPKEEIKDSNLSSQEIKELFANLNEDIFDIVIMILGVPKSLNKEGKITFMSENYKAVRIENAIQHARKIKP